MLKGIEANEDGLKEYVEKSVGIITAVNPHIGYEAATRVAKKQCNRPIRSRTLCEKWCIVTRLRVNSRSKFEMTHPGIAGAILFKEN